MSAQDHKEKRLHEGGVGPKMRSSAGLRAKNTTGAWAAVNDDQLAKVDPA